MHCQRDNVTSISQLSTREPQCDAPPKFSKHLPTLPIDIIIEILLWLPIRYLFQAKCVCKSWNSIISEPEFTKKHLCYSIRHPNLTHHRLLARSTGKFSNKNGFMASLLPSILLKTPLSIPDDYCTIMTRAKVNIIDTCNGIICLVSEKSFQNVYLWHVSLWNPSTRQMNNKLPNLSYNWHQGCFMTFGFGHDLSTGKYTVVSVFCDPNAIVKTTVKVYTLGVSNSWKQIKSFPHIPQLVASGKFVNGCLNWLATRTDGFKEWKCGSLDKLIMSLELGKETYKEILLPVEVNDGCVFRPGIAILRDCLCFSYDYIGTHFVVWMMKRYGVEQSWTKLFTIPYLLFRDYQLSTPRLLFLFENGELLLWIKNNDHYQLVLYNPKNQSLRDSSKKIENIWDYKVVYTESFVSPYN